MKFGKRLLQECGGHPGAANFFVSYKELKGEIKRLRAAVNANNRTKSAGGSTSSTDSGLSNEQQNRLVYEAFTRFTELLNSQLQKVNRFAEAQEKNVGIKLKELTKKIRDVEFEELRALQDSAAGSNNKEDLSSSVKD